MFPGMIAWAAPTMAVIASCRTMAALLTRTMANDSNRRRTLCHHPDWTGWAQMVLIASVRARKSSDDANRRDPRPIRPSEAWVEAWSIWSVRLRRSGAGVRHAQRGEPVLDVVGHIGGPEQRGRDRRGDREEGHDGEQRVVREAGAES